MKIAQNVGVGLLPNMMTVYEYVFTVRIDGTINNHGQNKYSG